MSRSISKCVAAGFASILMSAAPMIGAFATTAIQPHNVVINLDRESNYDTGILATFTCSLHGKSYVVSACLSSLNGFAGGTLNVVSGTYKKLYPFAEAADSLGYNAVSFHLHQHLRVWAKVASTQSGFVLRLKVTDDSGQTLYEDSTERFNSIVLAND